MINQFPKYNFPKHIWRAENKNGSSAVDQGNEAGSRTNGTISSATITDGNMGRKAWDFSGGSHEIEVTSFTPYAQTTVGAWVYFTTFTPSSGGSSGIMGAWETGQQSFIVRVSTSGFLHCFFYDGSTQYSLSTNTQTLPLNKWVFVCATADGANAKSYIDGLEVESTAMVASAQTISTIMTIGSERTNYTSGLVQDPLVFDYALTAEEIKYLSSFGYQNNIQADQNKLITLWNRLGSTTQINESEIGVGGSITGTIDFTDTVKFSGGSKIISNGNYIDFPITLGDVGCYELWFKPNYNSTETSSRYIVGDSVSAKRVLLRWKNAFDGFLFFNSPVQVIYKPTFSAGDVMHLACVWDNGGIAGSSNTMRFYYNGVMVSSSDSTFTTPNATDIRLGNASTGTLHMNGTIENFKVYNYAKTDFSDNYFESTSKVSGTNIQVNDDRIIIRNTLNSATAITNSFIGPDGTNSGSIIYGACKFGNGADYGAGAYSAFPIYFDTDKGTMEVWWRPTTELGATTCILFSALGLTGTTTLMTCQPVAGDAIFCWLPTGSAGSWIKFAFPAGTFIDTPTHVALVWDNTASARVRMFINNEELLVDSTNAWDNSSDTLSGGTDTNISTGSRIAGSDISNGELENFTYLNYAKTDFSDRLYQTPTNLKDVRL